MTVTFKGRDILRDGTVVATIVGQRYWNYEPGHGSCPRGGYDIVLAGEKETPRWVDEGYREHRQWSYCYMADAKKDARRLLA